MRLLLIGGGGRVGRQLTPHLAARHDLVVLDPEPPDWPGVRHIPGHTDSPGALSAMSEVDAVVHLAAIVPRGEEIGNPARVTACFAVNVGSVYMSLFRAHQAGIGRFIHMSTMSVYQDYGRTPVDLTAAPDATHPYGLSKRFAESACNTIAAKARADRATENQFTVCSLRLAFPTSDDDWPLYRRPSDGNLERPELADGTSVLALSAHDAAAATEAAIAYDGPYRTFAITGDPRTVINDDTSGVLGWAPQVA